MKQSLPRAPSQASAAARLCSVHGFASTGYFIYSSSPTYKPLGRELVGRPSGMYWREQPWRARGSSLLMKGGSSSTWGPGGRGEPLSQGQYPCNTSIFCTVNVTFFPRISIKLSCSFYSQLILKKKFLESPQLTGSTGS